MKQSTSSSSNNSPPIRASNHKFLLANCRSAAPKIDDIRATCAITAPLVFACTESWLSDTRHSDDDIFVCNYTSVRCDRLGRSGGGVVLWIKQGLQFERIISSFPSPSTIEHVIVAFPSIKLLFVCVYIPPQQSCEEIVLINDFLINSCDSFLNNNHRDYHLCICADFNRLDISNLCASLDLTDIDSPPTLGNERLDRFLFSTAISQDQSISTAIGPPIANSDHRSLLCNLCYQFDFSRTTLVKVFDYRPMFVNRFLDKIRDIDWSVIDDDNSVDDKCIFFHEQIVNCMKAFPVFYVPMSPKDKPWITPFIKHLIQKRWDAFRRKDFVRYVELKLLVKCKIIKAKTDWANKFNNPGDLWQKVNYINSRKNTTSLDNLFNDYSCTKNLCDLINSVFCNNFSSCNKITVNDIVSDCSSFQNVDWNFVVTKSDVFDQLIQLNAKKACGSDYVPTFVYKLCASDIAEPLARIYNYCIVNSYFPSLWKEAHVVPIPKCHNPSVYDLRPISLLCVPSKVFEKLIFNSTKQFFYSNLDSNQFGFRENSSTACALIKLHNHITEYYDNLSVAGIQVVALDYSKAFDSLNHNVIIRRFVDCNFPLSFIHLMYSYLFSRSQRVRVKNCLSDSAVVTSGVPQGSILGPSIFTLVMADLCCVQTTTCIVKYADDVTLSIPIFYSTNNVLDEINNVITWSDAVGLKLNNNKCKYLFISRSKNSAPVVIPEFDLCSSMKLLGVYFSNDLKWDLHFFNMFSTANRRAYAFRVLKSNLSTSELLIVYNSLIVSVFDYCAPLFIGLNNKNCNIIKSIQRKFHNIVCFHNCHCTILPDISARRIIFSINLFKKAHSDINHVLHSIIPKKRTFFIQPYSKSVIRKCSFIPYVTELVNNSSNRM